MVVNRSAPKSTIVPILIYEDLATMIDWLCRAFGFRERLRAERNGIVNHAQLSFRDADVMVGLQGGPFRVPQGGLVSQYVLVAVEDVDAHFAHARECGARVLQPPTNMPFGERHYTAEDPGGHRWTFTQHIADVAPEEWGATTVQET